MAAEGDREKAGLDAGHRQTKQQFYDKSNFTCELVVNRLVSTRAERLGSRFDLDVCNVDIVVWLRVSMTSGEAAAKV